MPWLAITMADTGPPKETHERLCPRCGSRDIRGLGRVVATATGLIRAEHRCQQCAITFWLYPDRRQGPRERRASD
jgi:hypothetical protein